MDIVFWERQWAPINDNMYDDGLHDPAASIPKDKDRDKDKDVHAPNSQAPNKDDRPNINAPNISDGDDDGWRFPNPGNGTAAWIKRGRPLIWSQGSEPHRVLQREAITDYLAP